MPLADRLMSADSNFPTVMVTITLKHDGISPDLRRLQSAVQADGALGKVLGRAVANVLKKHFREKNKTGNKLGGKRTNFWSRVAEAVNSPRTKGENIVVPISHPHIAQKVYGGTITPKKSKYLAIPVNAAAHGKSPRVIDGLKFSMTRSGTMLLGFREAGGFRALYVLKDKVTQAPDASALPKKAEVAAAMDKAARMWNARNSA